MLDLNNLYWEEKQNIELIKATAHQVWGKNCKFGELKPISSPYPEFEWSLELYKKTPIKLLYDRSALDIGIPKNGEYVLMSEYTNKSFIRGMKSTEPQNLLDNFKLLDEIVKKYIILR